MMRGKFIAIDGGDGAGKDTHIEMMREELTDLDVIYPRDPGGTETSLSIRRMLLDPSFAAVTPRAELLLFLAARAQLVEELIFPALQRGTNVICNRFDLSTIAYQMYGREREGDTVAWRHIIEFGSAGVVPDIYILLDVNAEEGMRRTKNAKGGTRDRFEREKVVFHARVNEGFRKHIVDYPNHLVINANRDVDAVHRDLLVAVRQTLGLS